MQCHLSSQGISQIPLTNFWSGSVGLSSRLFQDNVPIVRWSKYPPVWSRKRAEYSLGEYGFKHRAQWVFWGSLSSWARAWWFPLSLLFVCQSELTEFYAELTEFAPKLSEAQWVLSSETVLSKQYSARFLEIAAISEIRESNAALRFKGAMESRSRFAISGCDVWAQNPFFLRDQCGNCQRLRLCDFGALRPDILGLGKWGGWVRPRPRRPPLVAVLGLLCDVVNSYAGKLCLFVWYCSWLSVLVIMCGNHCMRSWLFNRTG